MFKKILVHTDTSEYSRLAIFLALELAQLSGAEIILLHVTFTPEALGYALSNGIAVLQDQIEINGEQALAATLAGVNSTGQVKLRKKQRPGHPAVVILEEVELEKVDLIVMGSRGYGPMAGSVLGSVSQRVLLKGCCPVLIVK